MGAFENEIMLWLHGLRQRMYKHERFTWINLALSIIPSPVTAFLAVLLAILQLYLCFRGKIPNTEKTILFISLLLGVLSFILSSFLLIYLVKNGWSLWHMINPLWWLFPLKQKLLNRDIINVVSAVTVK
ncbi:MAG: hypothetical protein GXY72_14085 [Deltaproteobacteria bacterium]|nr:hypothetical protein [Deltaproteobacteria bacterium]